MEIVFILVARASGDIQGVFPSKVVAQNYPEYGISASDGVTA